nr:serine/threonine-protein kinase CDG1-like [Arachis hypogaea]
MENPHSSSFSSSSCYATSSPYVVIACDATKDRSENEIKLILDNIRKQGDLLSAGDRLLVFCVLHRVLNPMGYQTIACPESMFGTNFRAMEEQVKKKADAYAIELLSSHEEFKSVGVSVEVKVTAGFPLRQVILQEVTRYNVSWIILDRHLRRDMRFYLNRIPFRVGLVKDDFSVDIWRSHHANITTITETKPVYSFYKFVPIISPTKEHSDNSHVGQKQGGSTPPLLCSGCKIRTELSVNELTRFTYSEIQQATNDFSKDNLIGEGGYGHVYKGVLKDGQQIAAKVRKEESSQGSSEFHSEVYVLSFARHKNIVMLLGFYCKENRNILIYEYICNRSLGWHLFDKSAPLLEWQQRYEIAIGTAKGLRFLHEECRGGPIIHRDLRPCNILLTHDYVPMLGDFGLAKWRNGDGTMHTRIMGTIGYLSPEYAETGVVSERTDVYAFGIVLLQLISGHKVSNFRNPEQQSLRQWAMPIIESLALHELIDTRLGNSYDTYQLYLMVKTAFFCVQIEPHDRPSMGEVVRLLEGESKNFHTIGEELLPKYNS